MQFFPSSQQMQAQFSPFSALEPQMCSFVPMAGSNPVPWNHTVPVCMPWFQTQSPFPLGDMQEQELSRRQFHNKRKGTSLDTPMLPSKQYISEEVMTARLRELHIGNAYSTSSANTDSIVPQQNSAPTVQTLQELEARLVEDFEDIGVDVKVKPKQDSLLVFAPEIKKIETDPILPRSILDQLQKPSMEIVLWKPPGGLVDNLIRATLAKDDKTKKGVKFEMKDTKCADTMEAVPAEELPLSEPFYDRLTTSRMMYSDFGQFSFLPTTNSKIKTEECVEEMNLI